MKLKVYSLPTLIGPGQLDGVTVVVVDVLRATTTMLSALKAGARAVIPCVEVDEALRIAEASQDVVLGGERGGVLIPGFDLGNSPAEYTPARVADKRVVMTTTNGTRALQACHTAARVLIGAFVNLSRVAAELSHGSEAAVVCAGTAREITREDVLFAGALIEKMRQTARSALELNDEGELAAAAWQASVGGFDQPGRLFDALCHGHGGRNLLQLGFDADIRTAAKVDSVPLLGELLLDSWQVVRRA